MTVELPINIWSTGVKGQNTSRKLPDRANESSQTSDFHNATNTGDKKRNNNIGNPAGNIKNDNAANNKQGHLKK